MSEGNENILFDSVKERLAYYKKHPTEALVVPALCLGYTVLIGALYVNVILYNVRGRDNQG